MKTISTDLLLLTTSLSQLKNNDRIKMLFLEGIHNIFEGFNFEWVVDNGASPFLSMNVCTRTASYGHIRYEKQFEDEGELFALFQNSVQLLAILFERLEQEKLLNSQKAHLQQMVYQQIKEIYKKQDDLNEMNEEFATMNEELIETNQSLLKSNQQLQKEIEHRKNTQEKLLQSQIITNRFSKALDQIAAYIYMKDTESRYIYANKQTLQLFNCTEKEIIGKTDSFFFDEATTALLRKIDIQVIESGIDSEKEVKIDLLDGSQKLYWEVKTPLYDDIDSKKIIGLCGISTDISEIKGLEQKLKHSYSLLSYIIEHNSSAIAVLDCDLNYVYVSQRYINDYKVKNKEIIGKYHYDVFPDIPQHWKEAHKKALAGEVSGSKDDSYTNSDGETIWTRWECRPWYKDDNSIGGIILYTEVITERKKIENDLIKSEKRLRSTLDNMMEGCMIIGYDWRLLYANHTIEIQIRQQKEKLLGKTLPEIWPAIEKTSVYQNIKNCLTEKQISHINEEFSYPDGTTSIFELNIQPVPEGAFILSIDISEKRRAEEKLKESENRFRNIYEDGPLGMAFASKDFHFIMANKTFCNILGYTEEELKKLTFKDVTHPDHVKQDVENINKLIKGEIPSYKTEKKYIRKDEKVIWASLTVTANFSSKGKFLYSVAMIEDITERKKASETLLLSEIKYRTFFENSIDAILLTKPNGKIISANPAACKLFGRTEEEIINLGRTGLVDISDPRLPGLLEERKRNGKARGELNFLRPDGTSFPTEISSALFQVNEGQTHANIIIRDITERKKAEEELRRLWRALDQSPDCILITDTNGKIEYANAAFTELSGYTSNELIGKNQLMLSTAQMNKTEYDNLIKTIRSGNTWHGEYCVKKKNGEIFWQSSTISPISDSKGDTTHFLAISEDVTEQKELTLELIKAKEKAEESDRLKSSFLANMSHEIRTPMNSIMGFASLLPEEESHELMSQYAQIIVRNSEQLVHIIDDIVLYSRLQTHLLSSFPSTFKVQVLFNDIKQSFNLPEFNKGVELITASNTDDNIKIYTDYEKVRQVITNLVSNAFKYTSSGSIALGATKQNDYVLFWVKDTGMGIPTPELEKVFDRFYRATNVNKGAIGGTGLGLSIVKELTELLGGKIWVESEINKGSTFYFTIKENSK